MSDKIGWLLLEYNKNHNKNGLITSGAFSEDFVEWAINHTKQEINKQEIDDFLEEMDAVVNSEATYPTEMKEAIIGYVERFGMTPQILLDKKKCIDILMKQGMELEEANEYFEFNIIGSFMGKERTPCFATLIEKNTSIDEIEGPIETGSIPSMTLDEVAKQYPEQYNKAKEDAHN